MGSLRRRPIPPSLGALHFQLLPRINRESNDALVTRSMNLKTAAGKQESADKAFDQSTINNLKVCLVSSIYLTTPHTEEGDAGG